MNSFLIVTMLQVSVFTLILFFAFMYSIFILFIRRFHQQNNIFVLNICISIIVTSVYFIIYFTMINFDADRLYAPHMCIVLFYGYIIAGIAIPFAFLTFSIHRLFSLIYYMKPFFKTKKWLGLCITSQWIIELIVSLPFLFRLKESVSIQLIKI